MQEFVNLCKYKLGAELIDTGTNCPILLQPVIAALLVRSQNRESLHIYLQNARLAAQSAAQHSTHLPSLSRCNIKFSSGNTKYVTWPEEIGLPSSPTILDKGLKI